jgi:hypothetical protein
VISVFSTLSGGLPFVAAFTVAVHRNWPTALITSALLALAAWPSLLLYNGHDGTLMLTVVVPPLSRRPSRASWPSSDSTTASSSPWWRGTRACADEYAEKVRRRRHGRHPA